MYESFGARWVEHAIAERTHGGHGEAARARIDEIGPHLMQVKCVKGHATMEHVCEGTVTLWQLQANELADEQAKKGSARHFGVKKFEQSYRASATFLGWLAKSLGRERSDVGTEAAPCAA